VSKFKVFSDLDVENAFYEILLHPDTSKKLSVQTPWGQFEPMFLPEGVSPASDVLMHVMYEIFVDYLEWVVVIFDNILVCEVDYDDAFDKLVKVVQRCRERNVYLKLSKSKFSDMSVRMANTVCRREERIGVRNTFSRGKG
jgi:hypothetical protein